MQQFTLGLDGISAIAIAGLRELVRRVQLSKVCSHPIFIGMEGEVYH